MTNRQMIMLKLIQLSDEEFAEIMDEEITNLMDGSLCEFCERKHGGECPIDTGEWDDCMFDLVEWLRKKVS